MNLQGLARINAATLAKIATDTGAGPNDEFFGFYEANLFDCAPFLMFTANDCPRAHDILYGRQFEPMSMKLWCRLAVEANVILDIGAHVGVYALAAASLRGDIPIHAFEPNPYAYSRLRVHAAVNGFDNIVDHSYGLCHINGFMYLSWDRKKGRPISSGGSLAQGDTTHRETVIVETKRLDDLGVADEFTPGGLIKIDVEGSESTVFDGMSKVLPHRPDVILETFSVESCDIINALVLPLGYRTFRIREDSLTLEELPSLQPSVIASGNLNQFLTVRSDANIQNVMSRRAAARARMRPSP